MTLAYQLWEFSPAGVCVGVWVGMCVFRGGLRGMMGKILSMWRV